MDSALWTHPAYASAAVDNVSVYVERRSATSLFLRYRLRGRIGEVVLPPPAPTLRANNLWQTTCFEAFLKPQGMDRYRELNFSPSGAWAAYSFSSHRSGMRQAAVPAPPEITLSTADDRLELDVLLSLDLAEDPYSLALAVIVEERAGEKSYWATNHAGAGKPDFHHPGCFVDELPPAAGA